MSGIGETAGTLGERLLGFGRAGRAEMTAELGLSLAGLEAMAAQDRAVWAAAAIGAGRHNLGAADIGG